MSGSGPVVCGGERDPDYKYPYKIDETQERENLDTEIARVLRGGAFNDSSRLVRCAVRYNDNPDSRYYYLGFRVAVSELTK